MELAQDLKNSTAELVRSVADHITKSLPDSAASRAAVEELLKAAAGCDLAVDFAFGDAAPKESAEPSAPAAADAGPATETAETPSNEIDDAELEIMKTSDPGAYAVAMSKKSAS